MEGVYLSGFYRVKEIWLGFSEMFVLTLLFEFSGGLIQINYKWSGKMRFFISDESVLMKYMKRAITKIWTKKSGIILLVLVCQNKSKQVSAVC